MIDVLVVDDSLYMQKRICEMLTRDGDIRVVGKAVDGIQAVGMARDLQPDVITMDLRMPRMGGLEATQEIMASNPKPIVIFSSYSKRDGADGVTALDLGAIDIVEKPNGAVSLELGEIGEELVEKVRIAARVRVVRNVTAGEKPTLSTPPAPPRPRAAPPVRQPSRQSPDRGERQIICFASSTGGPGVLGTILASLPQRFPLPIVIAQHMPGQFTRSFSEQLDRKCALRVKEAEEREALVPGVVYVAPGFRHLNVSPGGHAEILSPDAVTGPSPSANTLFESAVEYYGAGVVAIVLSGMGGDGARGVKCVYDAGGQTVAQEEASCAVFGMPKAAIETGCVRRILSIEQIISELRRTTVFCGNGGAL